MRYNINISLKKWHVYAATKYANSLDELAVVNAPTLVVVEALVELDDALLLEAPHITRTKSCTSHRLIISYHVMIYHIIYNIYIYIYKYIYV